jgi:hypothetical protein
MTTFYGLRFETPPTCGARWPGYNPGTGFPFHRFLRLAELRWRFRPRAPHGCSLVHLEAHDVNLYRWMNIPNIVHRLINCQSCLQTGFPRRRELALHLHLRTLLPHRAALGLRMDLVFGCFRGWLLLLLATSSMSRYVSFKIFKGKVVCVLT